MSKETTFAPTFSLQEAQKALENHIKNLNTKGKPKDLYAPIEYIMSLGGKRMRPLLVLLGYSLYDSEWKNAVAPAIVTEVFHNFTLLHDDIMDNAPIRRGQPTAHEKWDENTALLSGDLMLIKTYQWFLEAVPSDKFTSILQLFNTCAIGVCEGQQFDMEFESRNDVEIEEYLEMIKLKTAVLLGFSLELGAILGGAKPSEAAQLREVGILAGIGFQLHDDILDVYADPKTFGKRVGGDITENKKTYLMLTALELEKQAKGNELQNWIDKTDFDETEKVKAVTELYNNLNIRTLTEEKMNEYFEKSYQILENLSVRHDKQKQFLKQFLMQIQERQK
ncbi:geranylgeranyl pyrophosphate synthase [Bernardetia litoralis DSM 6794]|uniref:Geranylgeranyl pyrophosphate synthase n=1 Tax=Bernardetia litoralis (strain ATCC 23117 / DSM 6794 / NBRC 15988 / NCIMB 1366 / Fx l1 / Sio-4) TaxID=880071 RepID=I4AKV1_BERLS|nr:polyprenyl synthetase family protein [Bernardetia litoralis]AFM04586.1 geranylgeranyl pyrophosphate synthase [Bernardetia litoralis DSM 6794]